MPARRARRDGNRGRGCGIFAIIFGRRSRYMDRVAAITTFVKVVEAGSLSAAGRSLDLSPPSVSRQLDRLEEHLGTRLLVRTTRHLTLTEGGRTYYEQAKRILAAI